MRPDCLAFLGVVAAVFGAIVWSKTGTVTPRYGRREAANAAKRDAAGGAASPSVTFAVVSARASELAVALEQATRLGGVDLIGTYTVSDAGKVLYAGYLERLASLEQGARLRIKVENVRMTAGRHPEPLVSTVEYLVSGGEAQDAGRILGRQQWYWEMVRARCERCGAPQTGPLPECPYCGTGLTDAARWVVCRVETSAE